MKIRFVLTTILIIVLIRRIDSIEIFCSIDGVPVDDNKLVQTVFNIEDDIFLFRGEKGWIWPQKELKVEPTFFTAENRFLGIKFKTIETAFVVESVPDSNSCPAPERNKKDPCNEHNYFKEWMKGTMFTFYTFDGKNQIYSMMTYIPGIKSFTFRDPNNTIGGYGYNLRTNQSVARSLWPGIQKSDDQIKGSLFIPGKHKIVLFIKSNNKMFYIVKELKDPWDMTVARETYPVSNVKFVSAFRKGQTNYVLDANGVVSKMIFKDNKFTIDSKGQEKAKDFFKCN